MTNREYIESLGDVELAKFLYGLTEKKMDCPPAVTAPEYCRGTCEDCWIIWLRADYGDENWEWNDKERS